VNGKKEIANDSVIGLLVLGFGVGGHVKKQHSFVIPKMGKLYC
jgi:hypothetical protein